MPETLCAICQSPLGNESELVSCPECQAPYHAECWQENGGCAVYGCSQVPPTEHRQNIEIPVSYWGREKKPCPVCGTEILAAALRCRNCGTTFESALPPRQWSPQAVMSSRRLSNRSDRR